LRILDDAKADEAVALDGGRQPVCNPANFAPLTSADPARGASGKRENSRPRAPSNSREASSRLSAAGVT
jgi:hypothetical protein